jgi:ankyrin repeat protein
MTIKQIKQTTAYKQSQVRGKSRLDKVRLCDLLSKPIIPCEQMTIRQIKQTIEYKQAPAGKSRLNKSSLCAVLGRSANTTSPKTKLSSLVNSNSELLAAIRAGSLDDVKSAIQHGADAAPTDNEPMQEACALGNLDIIKYLVEKGANLNDGTALQNAILGDRFELVRYLFGHRTDLGSHTLLRAVGLASGMGSLSIVRFIVEELEANDMPPGVKDVPEYDRALRSACEGRHTQIVEYFLARQNPEVSRYLAIESASKYGLLDMLKLLCKAYSGKIEGSAIYEAIKNGHFKVVKFLVASGGVVDRSHLERASELGRMDILKYLVDMGGDIPASNALYLACQNGNLKMVKFCVKHGASVSGDVFMNCLIQAKQKQHFAVVKFLLKIGTGLDTETLREYS